MDLALIFTAFLPCFVIIGVAAAVHIILRVLPEPVQRFLQFNLTNPSANRTEKSRPQGKVSRSYQTDSKNRQLQHRLIEMLRGDTTLAKRLLRQQRKLNPGQSDNWYLEKVIRDLERDRRC